MCVAVPGKVTEINGNIAKVDFDGNFIEVNISLIDAKVGDYVLVHAGCAIEILKQETAEELKQLFKDLEEVAYE